jgi:hypothetical protein
MVAPLNNFARSFERQDRGDLSRGHSKSWKKLCSSFSSIRRSVREDIQRVYEAIEGINQALETHNKAAGGSIQVSGTLVGRQAATEERFRRTNERLNVLINVVEKHITGHNHDGTPS